jgi:hypothetical protein
VYVTLSRQQTAAVARQYTDEISKTDSTAVLVTTHLYSSNGLRLAEKVKLADISFLLPLDDRTS